MAGKAVLKDKVQGDKTVDDKRPNGLEKYMIWHQNRYLERRFPNTKSRPEDERAKEGPSGELQQRLSSAFVKFD